MILFTILFYWGEMGLGGGARVSKIYFTKNPNQKKKSGVGVGEGWGYST